MINKIGYIVVIFSTMFFLGCGGGSNGNVDNEQNTQSTEPLKVTIKHNPFSGTGNLTYDSNSKIPTMVIDIDSGSRDVRYIASNKAETSFSLEGTDKDLFELKERTKGRSYMLTFKDSSKVGEYEVTVKVKNASDTILFKSIISVNINTSKKILDRKTLYYNDTKNIDKGVYQSYHFEDNTLTIKDLNISNDDEINSTTYGLDYLQEKGMVYIDLNDEVKKCKAKYDDNQYGLYYKHYIIECRGKDRIWKDWKHLKKDKDKMKKYPYWYGLRILKSKDINNTGNGPSIKNFALRPNVYIKDNRGYLDNFYREGNSKIDIDFDNVDDKSTGYLFFHKKQASEITSTGNQLTLNPLGKGMLLYLQTLGNGKFKYSRRGDSVEIDDSNKFTQLPINGYLNLYICKDKSLNRGTCSFASIPVNIR